MNYAEKLIDTIHEAVKQGFTVQISVNDSMKFVTGWSDILYKIANVETGNQYGFCIPETWIATEQDKGITECVLFIDAMDKMKSHKVS